MDVTVSIVTYNSADCIAGCVESVLSQSGVESEVVIVDNASRDDTLERVKPFASRVALLPNRENVGFGRAHNQAWKRARGRFLLALNPDAWLSRSDSLRMLVDEMDRHPAWGLATPHIAGHDGPPFQESYPGQRHLRQALPALPGQIAWVLGASMFLRGEAFDRIRGFDEAFFLYSEETDLCLRLRQAGFEIGYVPRVSVGHQGGASEKTSPPYEVWQRKQRSVYRFFAKHYAPEDARRLMRRDLRISRFRLAMLWLTGATERKSAKAAKYRAMRDCAVEQCRQLAPRRG